MKEAMRLYFYASALVGAPILAIILLVGLQRAVFTLTCETASYRCERSFGSTAVATKVVSEIVADNEYDIEVKPRQLSEDKPRRR